MRHFAIIGSGPAGYYTAEALLKSFGGEARVDMIDRLPTPYGLVRSGVAPDHQSLKAVAGRFEKVSISAGVRFVGHVCVGRDVSVDELLGLYDAVVLATGAPADRPLDIPGGDLPGVLGSAAFVGWYNGHPDFADLDPPLDGAEAAVVGNGNVALDVARILAKTRDEFHGSDIVGHALDALETSAVRRITIVGRRGPHQIAMTPKELGELGHLSGAAPLVNPDDLPPLGEDAALDPGQRKSVGLLRGFAAAPASRPKIIALDFFAKPLAVEGNGRVERLLVERTRLDPDGRAQGTGETYAIPCRLLVSAIGYRTPPIDGVPYDAAAGRFANERGRIDVGTRGRLYAVGWARRGPSGTIGTNRPDGYEVADAIAAAVRDAPDGERAGGTGLDALLGARGVDVVAFTDWQRIEAAERARARDGSPREKFTKLHEMHAARGA
jgi:ferredoxin--NADP+ reductase